MALCILAFTLCGCGHKKKETNLQSVGLQQYKGHFITFSYPTSAKLVVLNQRESYLVGPSVTLHTTSNEPLPSTPPLTSTPSAVNLQEGDARPAYQIHIQIHDNPLKLTAEEWARGYIVEEWKRVQGGPSIYPVSQDGHILEDFVSHVRIGTQTAFMVDFYGYSDNTRSLFIARKDAIIELSFTLYPIETEPLSLMQKDLYAMILATISVKK